MNGQRSTNTHVDKTVASGFGADKPAAPSTTLASQDTLPKVLLGTVSTKHPANLPGRDTNVASRDICVGTNMLVQLAHESDAELADLVVGLALGVKVGTTLATAHGDCNLSQYAKCWHKVRRYAYVL